MSARLAIVAATLAVASAAVAASALAAPDAKALHHSKAEKPSDKGTRPATGRSGAAVLDGRALLDRQGNTLLELTTADFETGVEYSGMLRKADVKHFVGKRLADHENYKGIDSPTASFTYAGFGRGDVVQVKADVNVGKGDNEVVNVATTVARRPDVAPSYQRTSRSLVAIA